MKVGGIAGFFAFLAVFLFIFVFSMGFAAQDTIDVNVTIGSTSEITVSPNILNWTDVSLGAAATVQYFTVENTGSVNVTNLYVYSGVLTDEVVRPYGLGNASNYSAAAVITLNNLSGNTLYFVGRTEWNWTEIIQNINTTN